MLYNLTVKWKPAAQVDHHFMKTLVTLVILYVLACSIAI